MVLSSSSSSTAAAPLKLHSTTIIECGQNRISSVSVSWNADGMYLAMASSDRMAHVLMLDAAGSSPREVLVVSGHAAPVTKIRFHPTETTHLCSADTDATIRLWDVRAATQRATGRIDLETEALSVEWCRTQASILAVTERNGTVSVFDVRKLVSQQSASTTTATTSSNTAITATTTGAAATTAATPANITAASSTGGASAATTTTTSRAANRARTIPLHSFPLLPNVPETCVFSPDGHHLVTGTSYRGEGVGELRIWAWETPEDHASNPHTAGAAADMDVVMDEGKRDGNEQLSNPFYNKIVTTYAAHCGPIFALAFSPNGERLVTGGSDATACLWDVDSMCCITSCARKTKFIRGVAFSADSQLLAVCSEDDGIDIMECEKGAAVGVVNLSQRHPRTGGAEEVAWHPKEYLLACARTPGGPSTMAPVAVAKLVIS